MASPIWASPRDEFPESVHALMTLWGGFASPTDYSDSGLEKRLELDFAQDTPMNTFTMDELAETLAALQQTVAHHGEVDGLLWMELTSSILIVTPRKIVVTATSEVRLHQVLPHLLRLLREKSVTVEWAAYLRKNTTSPWCTESETSDIMAQEYADLKATFPAGKSFLTGPVDSDHYFNFVYDVVDRKAANARSETEAQLNVFLYDVSGVEAEGVPQKAVQRCTPLPTGEYEVMRTFPTLPCVSFETNAAAAAASPARVQALLDDFHPAEFTIVALQDRDVDGAALRRNLQSFNGYALQNRTMNYFGEGYAFHQLLFHRSE